MAAAGWGIQNVRRTIRVRSSATWQLDEGWKVGAGWSTDLLGRGGGNLIDLGLGHERRPSPRVVWNVGTGITWGDGCYTRSYYGVTPEASIQSGYPVHAPGSGLRDVSIGTSFRMEIDPTWIALWGGSIGKLMGPVAQPADHLDPPVVAQRRRGLALLTPSAAVQHRSA